MAKKQLPGRFRVLRGSHNEKEVVGKNEAGGEIRRIKKFRQGSVVVSNLDLEALFNGASVRKKKYEYLGPASTNGEPEVAVTSEDGLDSLKLDELKAVAESEGIDLGGATKKQDIVAAIREARSED